MIRWGDETHLKAKAKKIEGDLMTYGCGCKKTEANLCKKHGRV